MEMTGSCKAGGQPQSCSAGAFYPRHISLDVLLPLAHLTPSPSSLTTPPSQHPALRNASAKIISGDGCLSYDSTGVTSGTGRQTQGRVNRGVQDRWRSAARWTLIECRASAPFPGRHGRDGAENSNKGLGIPWEAVSDRCEVPRV